MKRVARNLMLVAGLVCGGCNTVGGSWQRVRVSAVLLDPEAIAAVGFTNLGYTEQAALIRVTEPAEWRGEVFAIPFYVAWGRNVTRFGNPAQWQKPTGSQVSFTIRRRDISTEWPREHRRSHADKVRDIRWANQSPLPTSTSVTPRAGARAAPAALVAGL